MTNDTKIIYNDYTKDSPYEGKCYPPNYWFCEKEPGMTLQEYAVSHNFTYEGARRKLLRYKDELIPHIRMKCGTQYLDDIAVKFLESHGRKRAVKSEIIDTNELKELQQKVILLTEENQSLKTQCQDLTNKLEQITNQYEEEVEKCNDLQRDKIQLYAQYVVSEKRSKHIQDLQYQMLRAANALTEKNAQILLDAEHWNCIDDVKRVSLNVDEDDD